MTAPTEPLVMSLEEAGALLAEHALVLLFDGDHDASVAWAVRPQWGPERWMRETLGSSWPEAVSEALGRPVVARDPAAELRAAAQRYLDELDGFGPARFDRATTADTDPLFEALDALRAALAATEGEEA